MMVRVGRKIRERCLLLAVVARLSPGARGLSTTTNRKELLLPQKKELISVAPMMAHTSRHHQFFYRLLSRETTLYTEMIPAWRLIEAFDSGVDPDFLTFPAPDDKTVLQLGGGDSATLQRAAAIGAQQLGYAEINLNCGCPSNNVATELQWGAALMRSPSTVASLLDAMQRGAGSATRISVKHRLGVADAASYSREHDSHEESRDSAFDFVQGVSSVCEKFIVHCRLGLLDTGASPMDNRFIPPLRLDIAQELAAEFGDLSFVANGGVQSLDHAQEIITTGNLGVMVGRAAINHPCAFADADSRIFNDSREALTRGEVLAAYLDYARQVERPDMTHRERMRLVTPPFHLFAGEPGGNRYMRVLKNLANRKLSTISAVGILEAAAHAAPDLASLKSVREAVPISDIEVFEKAKKQSGGLKRIIS